MERGLGGGEDSNMTRFHRSREGAKGAITASTPPSSFPSPLGSCGRELAITPTFLINYKSDKGTILIHTVTRPSERAIRERFCKIVLSLLTTIIAKAYSWLLLRENGCEIPGRQNKLSKNGHGYRCTARSNEISPTSKDSQAARSTDLRASRGHFQTQAVRIQHEIVHSQ
jgi:hypothetical protein